MFDAALRRAIAQDDGHMLRNAAEQLLLKSAQGEAWAIQMLADRLDGKAAQSVEIKQAKSIDELSLDELRTRVAELLAGARQPDHSAAQPGGVH